VKRLAPLLLLLAALPAFAAGADEPAELRNWFNDPFFQATSAVPGCPLPAGPFITRAHMLAQSHHRAEKGTTCWLAGQCDRPNYHDYDADIATALKAKLAASGAFAASSLWFTVQGRVVYVEGCIAGPQAGRELEAFVRGVEHVKQAIAIVYAGPPGRAPYTLLQPN
jgi:hypothetical protein